jgi:myo-inositol-1(or 4)-monophosphatase
LIVIIHIIAVDSYLRGVFVGVSIAEFVIDQAFGFGDVAAGIIIVQEAGGRVTDFSGGNEYLFGKEMICSNTQTHDQLLEAVRLFF